MDKNVGMTAVGLSSWHLKQIQSVGRVNRVYMSYDDFDNATNQMEQEELENRIVELMEKNPSLSINIIKKLRNKKIKDIFED